jgi:tetratricopeptide (TPR) repeat protein
VIRIILTAVILASPLCCPFWGTAAGSPELDSCNQLYHESRYEAAISCYEEIGTSAALLFNIGNSYARLDKVGYGILYYLRALTLTPGDEDILSNLNQLRKENSLFPPEQPFANRFLSLLNIYQWSWLCLAALAIFTVYLVLSRHGEKRLRSVIQAAVVCLAALALGGWGAWYHFSQWQRSVVIEPSRLLISPFEKSESVGAIEPGRLVTPRKDYRGYVHVTDETGRKGWLKKEHQAPIIPRSL